MDSDPSDRAVGEGDFSPTAAPRRNGACKPRGVVFPDVHTPYDYDQRI
jgi:hypothetical protein